LVQISWLIDPSVAQICMVFYIVE